MQNRGWVVDAYGAEPDLREIEMPVAGKDAMRVKVEYASLNYKDSLALLSRGKVLRQFPLVPGVDVAGVVEDPGGTDFSEGDAVCANGWGLGDELDGGYQRYCRVPAKSASLVPEGFSTCHAAAIGVAGFTAMLCVLALVYGEVVPDSGPVLVTGATGGVGSFSVAILSAAGYETVAVTGKESKFDDLRALGAAKVLHRSELDRDSRPLEKSLYAGAVDSVGGKTLATVLSQVAHGGTVAACGMAGGADLNTTVMPFILRAVTLAGIDASRVEPEARADAWRRLSEALDAETIGRLHRVAPLEEAKAYAERQMEGRLDQRVVFEI